MRFLLAASSLLCATTLSTSLAAADPAPERAASTSVKHPDAAQMHADDCSRARALNKTCVLDMKGDDIDGSTPTAGGERFTAETWVKASSLVHIRRDFITEIIKSAEDL